MGLQINTCELLVLWCSPLAAGTQVKKPQNMSWCFTGEVDPWTTGGEALRQGKAGRSHTPVTAWLMFLWGLLRIGTLKWSAKCIVSALKDEESGAAFW